MRRSSTLLAAVALVVTVFAETASALARVGDNGANRLVGTAENDTLRGLGGNGTLIGRGDSDRLLGGAGNDLIDARNSGRPAPRVTWSTAAPASTASSRTRARKTSSPQTAKG